MTLKEVIDIMSDHVPVLLYLHTPYIEHDNEYMWYGYSHNAPDAWKANEIIHIDLITWQHRKTLYIDLKA